jgi:hypothetical protein
MTLDSGMVSGPEAPARRRRAAGHERSPIAVLRSVRDAVLRSLVAITYLIFPFLVWPLPPGRDTVVMSLQPSEPAWLLRPRGADAAPFDAAALPVPIVAAPSPRASRRLAVWMERVLVRVGRMSAWRNARSRASVIPTWTGADGRAVAVDDRVPSTPISVDAGSSTLVMREPWTASVAPATDEVERGADFPIDVVYTWVDDHDPAWRARYELAALQGADLTDEIASPARFHNRDELRYSLRSLALYAPFVRNVYLVTAGQVPAWLDTDAPNLRVVPHEEILGPDCLPTFNSHAIESALHRIDGLAEHYLYVNDDFFFGRECSASTFFTRDGHPRLFPDQRAMVPDGPCSPADRPVDSASKNTREIMSVEFDFPVRHKMRHVPYPQRRSVLYEMEQRFPLAFKQTARNAFRHHTDVNIPSCLSHYYAFVTGAAVPGAVAASYINIGNAWAQLAMRRLLHRADRDVFCLNDTPMSSRRRAIVDASVKAFLEAYFPVPAPFERRSLTETPEADHIGEAVDRR